MCTLHFETCPSLAAADHNSTTAKKCGAAWLYLIACCKSGEVLKAEYLPNCGIDLQIKALKELKGTFDKDDNRLLVHSSHPRLRSCSPCLLADRPMRPEMSEECPVLATGSVLGQDVQAREAETSV